MHDWRESRERTTGGFNEIGEQMGVHPESLRNWFKQWQIDVGKTPGLTTADQRRMAELEAQVCELERSNKILRSASASNWVVEAHVLIESHRVMRRLRSLGGWSHDRATKTAGEASG